MTVSLTIETLPLSAADADAESQLLARFARFWAANADAPMRDTYDLFIAGTPLAADVVLDEVRGDEWSGRPPGWWVLPRGVGVPDRGTAILYLHGGAHVLGSAAAYRGFASQIAVRTGQAVFVLEVPLAPEHPFPAAPDAALSAARWLKRSGVQRIAVVGDSAGGGLALSVIASLVEAMDAPDVAAGAVFSPWTDLSLSGASMSDPAVHDALLARAYLAESAAKVLGGTAPGHPRASPLFGVPRGLPPLLIQVGSEELLLDDAKRYALAAAEQGVEVRLEIWERLHHVFQLNVAELESSRLALDRAADFVLTRLSRGEAAATR